MKPNLYSFNSYRDYLKERLEHLGTRSGLKRRAAEALQVHTTFVSQVVLGKADLSLDQAERICDFLALDNDESEYFLELVILERASEPKLKKRFEAKIKSRQRERAQIKNHLQGAREISAVDQSRFYSSHIYGLLHVLSSIPKYQTRKNLIEACGYPPELASDAIDFLIDLGVVKSNGGKILPGEQHVHLGRESKQVKEHHTNWRTATIQHMAFAAPEDLHYSLAFSCSEGDAVKIRESLLAHLRSISRTIAQSKEEAAYVYAFDLFKW